MNKRIARVFPRRTKATPTDGLAFIGYPGMFPPEVDEVHVSCTFTWDLRLAEELALAWDRIAPTKLGGPATGARGDEFIPGMYLREGYTITSRGCPNNCWFCYVPKREGMLRELPIKPGYNVLDDNLLACSEKHFQGVCAMLAEYPEPAEFTGGLEAARLTTAHVEALARLRLRQIFFAYDDGEDWEPLVVAARMMDEAGLLRGHRVRCYVLIGYPGDTMDAAEKRLGDVVALGIMPMAMLWRDDSGKVERIWRQFQRTWANPVILGSRMRLTGAV